MTPSPLLPAALAAHDAGLCVYPPKQDGSKRPDTNSWTRFQSRRPSRETINLLYDDPERSGIGYFTGAVSGNLALFDFDDAGSALPEFEALLADNGLDALWAQIKAGYGARTPGGGFHALLRCPEADTIDTAKLAQRPTLPEERKHDKDTRRVLIEVKAEGGYTVEPPSNGTVHPSGGAYVQIGGGPETIAVVTPDELRALLQIGRLVDKMPREAAGPAPSPRGPAPSDSPGNAYTASTTWEDLLPRYGWAVDSRRGQVTYWRRPGKDRDHSASTNHKGSDLLWVFTTSTELEADRSYDRFGFYAVMEHGGDFRAAAGALAEQGYGRPANVVTLRRGGEKAKEPDDAPPTNWAHWPDPPAASLHGWFGDYLALMEPTTEAPPAFHLASALTVAGAAIGKRVRTEYASEPLFANLYTVLIGPSGSSRKDTAIKRALSLSWPPQWERQIASLPYQTLTDVSSSEGLIRQMEREPNTLLYLTELSNLMRNARRKGTSTILSRLIEAYDTPAKLSNLSKGDPQEVVDPYLSIIAATQPGILATEIGVEDIHSGFANRWLFVPGDRRERKPTPPKLDKAASWRLWRDLNDAVMSYGVGTALGEADDVQAVWDDWYLKERSRTEEEGSMSVRHPVMVRKIALILAVSDKAKRIELAHVRAAIAFVDWMWEQTRILMTEWGVGVDKQIETRITDVLAKRGPMKKRDLQRVTSSRKWSAADFDRTFRAMQNNQTIGFDNEGMVGLRND